MKRKIAQLFDKIERHADISRRSLLRYTWSPASETGRRELERSQKHEDLFLQAVKELRAIVGTEDQ